MLGAVHISARTFSWVGTPGEAVSNEAIRTFAVEAAQSVLADGAAVARLVDEAFIDVIASIRSFFESGLAVAGVEGANLVDLTVVICATTNLAVSVYAELSGGAFAVPGTRRHAEISDAGFSVDAAAAGRSTAILEARQTARTVATTAARAGEHGPRAPNLWSWIADQTVRTRAIGLVVPDGADGVRTAQTSDEARVLATVLAAGLLRGAIGVRATTNLAIAIGQTGFLRWAVAV